MSEDRLSHDEAGLAGLGRLERAVHGFSQQLDQIADAQAALVGLVDESVNFVQGAHDVQVEHGERKDIAES